MIVPATLIEFFNALRVTFVASIIPISSIIPNSLVLELYPNPFRGLLSTLNSISEGSTPVLVIICLNGAKSASLRISRAAAWLILSDKCVISISALINAIPPPGKIPSSIADFTAKTESSTRSYISFCSISLFAPTKMTPTPPDIQAILSLTFFLSTNDVLFFSKSLRSEIWAGTLSSIPSISRTTTV